MKKNQLQVGKFVVCGGDVVEIVEIVSEGIVVECSQNGQYLTSPASLSPIGEFAGYEDIQDLYEDEPFRPVYYSNRCEDAPCCGCC